MDQLLIELAQFHFLRPQWFAAIIPAVVLLILLWRRRSAAGAWQKVIAPHLLQHLLQGSATEKSRAPLILLFTAWVIACFAMAGPTWKKHPQAVQKKVDAQVIVMDLSLSMFAQDISPSRLERAKHKLSDILKRSKEGLTGLIVFAGTPHVVTPLTDDTRTILSMVGSLSPDIMPIPGSDPAAAVIKAQEVMQQGGMHQGHIILITDDLPANFVEQVKAELNTQNTPVSIFAVGTMDGSPIALPDGNFVKDKSGSIVVAKVNEQAMKTAAKRLRGRFTTLTYSDEDVDYLLEHKASLLDQEMKETERDFDTWDEAGHWLVVLLLPLAAAGYRKGWLGVALLPIVMLAAAPQTAHAGLWQDLWQTRDQQGQQAWRAENYEQAANTFADPMWKGSAHYRADQFDQAAQEFAKLDTADGHYNRGNALAKQQKIDEAIAAYEEALAKQPDMEDAQKNLEYLKQLKEQQQQQGDQGQEGEDNQQSDQQQSQQQNQESQNPDQQQQNQQQEQNNQENQQGQEQSSQDQGKPEQGEQQSESEQQKQQNQRDKEEQDKQQEQQQAQMGEPQDQDEYKDQPPRPITPKLQDSQESAEDQQALQQWLERVPDEPGGLLRRKFKMESQLRNRSKLENQAW